MNKGIALVSTLSVIAWQSVSMAVPTTIVDTTTGTAVHDGTVNGGEYVGSSVGINSGFGNVIGSGSSMFMDSDTAGALNIGFTLGGGGWNDSIVIYIDSVSGGFADTTTLEDQNDQLRNAISGDGGGSQSEITFASGFLADYAIALRTADNFAGLWQLAAGGNNSLVFSQNANLATNLSGQHIELQLALADIGIAANSGASFNYVATYLNQGSAFRSDEFHGVAQATANAGNIGQNPIALADGDFNTFTTIPEPTTLAFFGLGLVGIAVRTLRRRNA